MVISAGLTEGSDSVQTFQCGGPQPKERDQELGVSPGPSRERMAIHLGGSKMTSIRQDKLTIPVAPFFVLRSETKV
jgi:hypothetical protein